MNNPMDETPSTPDEALLLRIDRVLDGPTDENLQADLLAELTGDEHKKALFAKRLLLSGALHHALTGQAIGDDSLLAEQLLKPRRGSAASAIPPWLFTSVSLIAILAMFTLTYQASTNQSVSTEPKTIAENRVSKPSVPAVPADQLETIAILTDTGHCQWGSNNQPTSKGTRLHAGRMELTSGMAELAFVSGVKLTLEGPAVFELVSQDRCRLTSGAVSVHVPPAARGFTIESPNGEVIDFGTEFGMRVKDGRAFVQVFEGEVEVASPKLNESERLFKGHAANLGPTQIDVMRDAIGEFPLIPSETTRDAEHLTYRLPSSEGRGSTEYVYSPGSYNHKSETLLLVKNSKELPWRRIAYLRFDLKDLPSKLNALESASLTISFVPSNYGFASRVPDCEFTVYGLINEDFDLWNASSLAWSNAPGITTEGDLDQNLVVPVAKFVIKRDETIGVRILDTPELTNFLKADSNGLVTLLLARDTTEGASDGLVHAFAGNRHPTIAPPSLQFTWQKNESDRSPE